METDHGKVIRAALAQVGINDHLMVERALASLALLELRESDRQSSEPTVQRISEMTNDSLLHYGDVTVHRLASGWWVSKNSGANTLARSPERALFYIRRRSNDA